jgi:hypothetical protein
MVSSLFMLYTYILQNCVLLRSRSTGMVVFNYKDCNNTLQRTEVREDCSCPFCSMLCGSFKVGNYYN